MRWERIEYLLERMIPVAEECKVRMGNSQKIRPCHQDIRASTKCSTTSRTARDRNRQAITAGTSALVPLATFRRFGDRGLPQEYFGSRNTIFLVHYRLPGKRYSFREAPDEGDGLFKVLKALKDVGYCYGIDPDHAPAAQIPQRIPVLFLWLYQCDDPSCIRLKGRAQ